MPCSIRSEHLLYSSEHLLYSSSICSIAPNICSRAPTRNKEEDRSTNHSEQGKNLPTSSSHQCMAPTSAPELLQGIRKRTEAQTIQNKEKSCQLVPQQPRKPPAQPGSENGLKVTIAQRENTIGRSPRQMLTSEASSRHQAPLRHFVRHL